MLAVQTEMFEFWEWDWEDEFRTCINGYSISIEK